MPDEPDKHLFGERLKELRGDKTQDEVLALLHAQGFKRPTRSATIGAWERGENMPSSARAVQTLEVLLNATPGHLTGPLIMPARTERDVQPAEVPIVIDLLKEALHRLDELKGLVLDRTGGPQDG